MNEEENTITVKIFRNSLIEGDTKSILASIADDINKEYTKVAHILKNFPAVKAEIAGEI